MSMKNEHLDDWLADVRAAYVAGDLVEPPEWVRANAVRAFRTRLSDSSAATSTLPQRIRALLVFDSRRPGLAAAGVRSSGMVDGPWQLLYRGGNVDVDLLIRPNQDGHTMNVRGQALSLAGNFVCAGIVEALPSDVPFMLHGAPPPSVRSEVDPSGEFALANLERGRYNVLFHFGAQEIELSGVEF
jgi:hypothetical protein